MHHPSFRKHQAVQLIPPIGGAAFRQRIDGVDHFFDGNGGLLSKGEPPSRPEEEVAATGTAPAAEAPPLMAVVGAIAAMDLDDRGNIDGDNRPSSDVLSGMLDAPVSADLRDAAFEVHKAALVAEDAEKRAAQANERASQAEARAAQAEERATVAEERAAQAEAALKKDVPPSESPPSTNPKTAAPKAPAGK